MQKVWIPIALGFLLLAVSFTADWWDMPYAVGDVAPVDSTINDPATVRLSAAELVRTGGDTSMLDCYACHERDAPPEVSYDEEGRIIWEEHKLDFELRHGANHRNEFCYTCHVKENLVMLQTPQGLQLDITSGNLLCGSCHGTTYRDWEIGVHGLANGYWNTGLGLREREDCTSCHNAHDPAFPRLAPWPAPQPLRPPSIPAYDATAPPDTVGAPDTPEAP